MSLSVISFEIISIGFPLKKFILSSSDLVIISFFGTNDLSTLTQTIYRLLGSYRIEEARALSLLFLAYCLLYFILPKYILGRTYKDAPFD